MGVAVLSPQDCLSPHHHPFQHHRHLISANKPRRTPNPNPNPNTTTNRSSRRRRNSPSPPPSSTVKPQPRAKSPPTIGQFRILKRGEDLNLPVKPVEPEVVILSEPVPVPIRDGFYAGSAIFTSPPPSSLPLPAFFSKRNCGLSETQNQEIALELRKVLKLN